MGGPIMGADYGVRLRNPAGTVAPDCGHETLLPAPRRNRLVLIGCGIRLRISLPAPVCATHEAWQFPPEDSLPYVDSSPQLLRLTQLSRVTDLMLNEISKVLPNRRPLHLNVKRAE